MASAFYDGALSSHHIGMHNVPNFLYLFIKASIFFSFFFLLFNKNFIYSFLTFSLTLLSMYNLFYWNFYNFWQNMYYYFIQLLYLLICKVRIFCKYYLLQNSFASKKSRNILLFHRTLF